MGYVVNFDVLAGDAPTIVTRPPVPPSFSVWAQLYEAMHGRILIAYNGDRDDHEQIEHWLKSNGIKPTNIVCLETDDTQLKCEKLHAMMGTRDWYIDVDPSMVAYMTRLGVSSMLWSLPYVVRPEWTGEHKRARQWSELVAEIDRQKVLKAEREWKE